MSEQNEPRIRVETERADSAMGIAEARWRAIAEWAAREVGEPQEYFGPAQELLKELGPEEKR
jgi:hypothetical protein